MLDFSEKPVIAMLHLNGNTDEEIMRRMIHETDIYYRNGVDAVVTTGAATGRDCPTEKFQHFRGILGDFL